MRHAPVLPLALLAAACPLADKVGPHVITRVAPLDSASADEPADWLELCNNGDRDLPLKDHALRAVVNGVEITVLVLGEDDVLPAHRRALLGPSALVPDIQERLDLPQGPGRVTLRWYDHERTLVDEFSYALPSDGTRTVATRRCDCVSNGAAADDAVVLPRTSVMPGRAPDPACTEPADAGAASSSTSSSSSGSGGASSSSGGTDPCALSGCHALFPVTVAGATRTYALEGGGAGDVMEVTLLGGGSSGAAGTFQVRSVSTENGSMTTQVATYRCSDDLLEQLSLSVMGGTTQATTTFNPALRVLVPGMTAGSSFTQEVTATISATTPVGPVERMIAFSQEVTVTALEDVAGVSTLKVVQDATLDGSPQQQVTWYAPRQGVVKQVAPPLPGMSGGSRTWTRNACGP